MNGETTLQILDTPRFNRRLVHVALLRCTPADLPILQHWLAVFLVHGDWRRVAVRKRIDELRKEQPR